MIVSLRWIRLLANFCFFVILVICALNYKTSVYLIYQAKGQILFLWNTQPLETFAQKTEISPKEKDNIRLIAEIKKYSVDSLAYDHTKNFTDIYDQKGEPVLWVITACEPYELKPFEWKFPVVGRVSYKGFFEKDLANKEYTHMIASGYDADLRSVSAWSTLGWFHDPVLSSMIKRSKGSLCNLVFHELFHATYYAASSVNFNENIANFIAHKATLRFLANDSSALMEYVRNYSDNLIFKNYMLRRITYLKKFYGLNQNNKDKYALKLSAISQIADSIDDLPLADKSRYLPRKKEILKFKNAYFVDFVQYDSMQDSLEEVFNKIYKGNIEKMVQDLKLN